MWSPCVAGSKWRSESSAHACAIWRAPPASTSMRASRGCSGSRRTCSPERPSQMPARSRADADAETREQRQRRVERVFARPLEPFERARIAAPRDDVQHGARQIDAVDLRLAVRPQPIARVPQTPHDARRQAAGPAGALIGGVHA